MYDRIGKHLYTLYYVYYTQAWIIFGTFYYCAEVSMLLRVTVCYSDMGYHISHNIVLT